MTRHGHHAPKPIGRTSSVVRGLTGLTATLMLGACAQTSDLLPSSSLAVADTTTGSSTPAPNGQSELQRATEYWGQEFAKSPSELQPALNYARNLKAMGEKQKALAVLQQASSFHDGNAELASEYGRLALELDQITVADKLLAIADKPTQPDWRVISARGTVLAKQGKFKESIPYYERALTLSANQASVLNNLAMAHAMLGEPAKAEGILRQAAGQAGATPKVRENLALVLGLQGRYEEAKQMAAASPAADDTSANTDYIRSMVKLPPNAAPAATGGKKAEPTSVAAATTPAIPKASAAQAAFKPSTIELSSAQSPTTGWQASVAGPDQ